EGINRQHQSIYLRRRLSGYLASQTLSPPGSCRHVMSQMPKMKRSTPRLPAKAPHGLLWLPSTRREKQGGGSGGRVLSTCSGVSFLCLFGGLTSDNFHSATGRTRGCRLLAARPTRGEHTVSRRASRRQRTHRLLRRQRRLHRQPRRVR